MSMLNFLLKGFGLNEKDELHSGQVNVNLNKISNQNPLQQKPNLTSSIKPNNEEKKDVTLNNLVVYAPKNNDEIHLLVDCLKRGEAIIIDLSNVSKSEVQRIIDYLNGALQALNGTINRLQGNLFVLTPKSINITTI